MERLVIYTAMEDAQLAADCEAVLRPLLDAARAEGHPVCEGCPPADYPTDKTRCSSCPRRPEPQPPLPHEGGREEVGRAIYEKLSQFHVLAGRLTVNQCMDAASSVLNIPYRGGGEAGLDKRGAGDGWRPISEAPKDGTRIIGCDATRRYVALGYFDAVGEFDQVDRQGGSMGMGFYPTHWRELPAPPLEALPRNPQP